MGREGRDALGARMKNDYEFRSRLMLPRRTCTIVRLDGRCFSQYTRGLDRPFDAQLVEDMGLVAKALAEEVAGCRLAYTQSDEISLIVTDYTGPTTQAWFDGNQQKIVSISAALATAVFNELRPGKRALFDARAFTIPDYDEVINYLVWRQQDATRNSVSMAAQSEFSHASLQGRSSGEMQEMLWSERGINWNDYNPRFRRGTVVAPITRVEPVTYVDRRTGEECTTPAVERRTWEIRAAPIFTRERAWMDALLCNEVITEVPDSERREVQA